MDQLICASLSHTHYWYEVGMLKVPACRGGLRMYGIVKGGGVEEMLVAEGPPF